MMRDYDLLTAAERAFVAEYVEYILIDARVDLFPLAGGVCGERFEDAFARWVIASRGITATTTTKG